MKNNANGKITKIGHNSEENLEKTTDNEVINGSKVNNLKSPEISSKVETPEERENREKEEKQIKRLSTEGKKFIRVGDDYYKIVYRPNKRGELFKDLKKISKTTITDDNTKRILRYISKYEDFTIVPAHIGYKQVISGFYNQYYELSHKPTKGNFDNILHIIKHIFGETYYDFALDYLKILYTNPLQRLPILLIESEEKNTGKSTFGNLLVKMFQDNTIKIGNNDLSSDFNSVWIQRLLIIIDEASLDKEGVYGMLKRYSTETGKVVLNQKNKEQISVDFIGKFIFFSNDEGRAVKIERGDPRWAVFKVPTFSSMGYKDDPQMEQKITDEIPHFLQFLIERELVYKDETRMYFDTKVYYTPQLKLYFENGFTTTSQAINQLVQDTFDIFPEVDELRFSIPNIIAELKDRVKFVNRKEVQDCLEKELKIKRNDKNRYTYYSHNTKENDESYIPENVSKFNSFNYTFNRKVKSN